MCNEHMFFVLLVEVMDFDSPNDADKGSPFISPQVSMYTTMLYLVSLLALDVVNQQ